MMLARDDPTSKSSSRVKKELEPQHQGRASTDELDRDGAASRGSSQDKRKYGERDSEPPADVGMQQQDAFAPEPKRERSSYYDVLDATDSPSSYPKHVIVPASDQQHYPGMMPAAHRNTGLGGEGPDDDTPLPPHLHHNMAAQGSFSPPDHGNKGSSVNGYSSSHHPGRGQGAQLLTPDSIGGRGQPSHSYDSHHYSTNRSGGGRHLTSASSYHDVYRTASYTPEMDYGGASASGRYMHPSHSSGGGPPSSGDSFARPRRWACDYCNVATFLSYEEACAHEEQCPARHNRIYNADPSSQTYIPNHGTRHNSLRSSTGVPGTLYNTVDSNLPPSTQGPLTTQGTGLGSLYQASQEVVTPPTPHRHPQPSTSRWSNGSHGPTTPHGPPLPVFPHEQGYYRSVGSTGGYYDGRNDDPALYSPQEHHDGYHCPPPTSHDPYHHPHPYHPAPSSYHHPHHPPHDSYYSSQNSSLHSSTRDARRIVLAMPSDRDSLSDRQCYVRSEMVEIFAATEKDVAARHSKGAQKLVIGQVGIRCIHCRHLRPRDRAERAVCYPSSISRIYQTVADMQRFHFEQCREIPDHVRQIYKKLKTTRPRGVGSPQTYWISSAKTMGLADTGDGIRFDNDNHSATSINPTSPSSTKDNKPSDMSIV